MLKNINKITTKKLATVSVMLLILSVIPLLILGRYNVMCVDDYCYGIQVHDTWIETGSVWQSVKVAVNHTLEFYFDWQGTYVSCFLMSMCPMNFDYGLAYLVPIIMIGMFSISTCLLGRQIFLRWLGGDESSQIFIVCMILFLFWQVMEAPFEGIYWYNGATHYILMESFLFLMLTAVSGIIWTKDKRNEIIWCILASLIGVVVGGGNLVTGLQAEVMLGLLLIYAWMNDRKKIAYMIFPFVCFTVGFFINILAPGNVARGDTLTSGGYTAIASIMLSFYNAIIYIVKWTSGMVVLVWVAVVPVMWNIGKTSQKKFKYPIFVTLGFFCVLAAMFTPTLYALGEAGLARINNIIQMIYYLGLFLVTTYWFGWFNQRKDEVKKDSRFICSMRKYEQYGNAITIVAVLFILVIWVLTPNKNTYAGISALRSIVNGDAQTFYIEEMKRHEMYLDDTIQDVVVETHSTCPYLFEIRDVSWDVNNWINQAMVHYYHKNSLYRVVNEDS